MKTVVKVKVEGREFCKKGRNNFYICRNTNTLAFAEVGIFKCYAKLLGCTATSN